MYNIKKTIIEICILTHAINDQRFELLQYCKFDTVGNMNRMLSLASI